MENIRFILQPSKEKGYWVATDTEHNIVVTFKEHEFNETQKVTLLDRTAYGSTEDALKVATYLREMADWLARYHYNTAMPPLGRG